MKSAGMAGVEAPVPVIPMDQDVKSRCPHCGAVAGIEDASSTLRYRCAVCGGPRIPLDYPGAQAGERADQALKRAQEIRRRIRIWRAGALLIGFFGVMSVLIGIMAIALTSPGFLISLMTVLVGLTPLFIAGFAGWRSQQHHGQLTQAVEQAWQYAGAELVGAMTHGRGPGAAPLDTDQFRKALRLEANPAERLLMELQAHDLVSTLEDADGNTLYYAPEARRLRVSADGETPALTAHHEGPDPLSLTAEAEGRDDAPRRAAKE